MKLAPEELSALRTAQMTQEAQTLAAQNASLRLENMVLKLNAKYGVDLTKTPIAEDGTFEVDVPVTE